MQHSIEVRSSYALGAVAHISFSSGTIPNMKQ